MTAETLSLVPLGDGLFRVEDFPSPFTELFNFRDVARLDCQGPNEFRFVAVAQPSEWSRTVLIVSPNAQEVLRDVLARIDDVGGRWVFDLGGVLKVFLPPECPREDDIVMEVEHRLAGGAPKS